MAEPNKSDPNAPDPASRTLGRRLLTFVGSVAAALVVIGLAGVATVALYARGAAEADVAGRDPLPVETATVRLQDGYRIARAYVGRVEPARTTRLAFERSGLVTAMEIEEGDRVRRGQPLAALDRASLEAERERLLADRRQFEARLELAQRTSRRQGSLANRGFSSDQRADEAKFEADALRAQIAGVAARIKALEIDLAKSRIEAPFDGVIALRLIDEGAVVAPGAAVAVLQEVARPQLRIGLPPETAARLRVGGAFPAVSGGRRFSARLLSVAPDVDPAVRTVTALFALETAQDGAPPPPMGDVARVLIEQTIPTKGVWAPLLALREAREGLWSVYTLRPTDEPSIWTVGLESVRIVAVEGDRAFVEGTLQDGARIVVAGLNRIARGQRVALAEAGQAAPARSAPDATGRPVSAGSTQESVQ